METQNIKNNIVRTLHLIEEGNFDVAKSYFNKHVLGFDKNFPSIKSNVSDVRLFIGELDDYLHDPAVQITGAIQLEDLKKTFLEIEKYL